MTIKTQTIEAALSAAQKKQLARDIQTYLGEELRYAAQPMIEKVAKNWLKNNESWLTQTIEGKIKRELKDRLKYMRIDL